MGTLASCPCAEPRGRERRCWAPINNYFFAGFSPVGLVDTSPIGFQSGVFWRPVSHVGVLKVGVLDVWSKPFILQGEARIWHSLLIVQCCVRGGIYGEHVSQPFPPVSVYFLSHLKYRNSSVLFWVPHRGHCSVHSCIFGASWEEGNSGASYIAILVCSQHIIVLSLVEWFLAHNFWSGFVMVYTKL